MYHIDDKSVYARISRNSRDTLFLLEAGVSLFYGTGPVRTQVDIGFAEVSGHSKAPSCAWFSHLPLTLSWPSLRRNRDLLVPSTDHLSLVFAWKYNKRTLTASSTRRFPSHVTGKAKNQTPLWINESVAARKKEKKKKKRVRDFPKLYE